VVLWTQKGVVRRRGREKSEKDARVGVGMRKRGGFIFSPL
jgi:hypothetical protein